MVLCVHSKWKLGKRSKEWNFLVPPGVSSCTHTMVLLPGKLANVSLKMRCYFEGHLDLKTSRSLPIEGFLLMLGVSEFEVLY